MGNMPSLSSPVHSSRFMPNFMGTPLKQPPRTQRTPRLNRYVSKSWRSLRLGGNTKFLHLWQFEAGPARSVEQFVGFVVADEFFGRWIPLKFAVQFACDIDQVANGDRAVA